MALYVDLKKDFGGFVLETQFQADGDVVGILGASGCGKSMTLRCIAGIVKPDEGRIELDGTVFFDSAARINLKPQRRHVGLLFQNYALFPNMTVYQNLMTGMLPYEKDKKKARETIDRMIERFYIGGLEHHRPFQLSGGQQQRVALARILLSKPKILMLDEPFSALDDFLRWKLELELADVLRDFEGNTLFVSHDRNEIYRICDRVCVMDKGKSEPVIPVKQMFRTPRTRSAAYLSGCKNFSRARADKDGKIFALDWGVALHSQDQISNRQRYVGVRSHFIHPLAAADALEAENKIRCRIERVVEDVFSIIVMLCPIRDESGRGDTEGEQIRMELTKEEWFAVCEETCLKNELWVYISSADVMLLE